MQIQLTSEDNTHAECVACNIRCVIWADISSYASLRNVQ